MAQDWRTSRVSRRLRASLPKIASAARAFTSVPSSDDPSASKPSDVGTWARASRCRLPLVLQQLDEVRDLSLARGRARDRGPRRRIGEGSAGGEGNSPEGDHAGRGEICGRGVVFFDAAGQGVHDEAPYLLALALAS